MTARFLALYETPADPEEFDRHYHDVHIPLGRRLPGLRRYTVGRDVAAVRRRSTPPGTRPGTQHDLRRRRDGYLCS